MALFLYNLSILSYGLLIRAASLFNGKASKFVSGRKGLAKNLRSQFENNQRPVAWFHVASLGEFEQAKPVIEAFKVRFADHKIFITFFSPSGYEQRKNYEGADFISYLPLDTPGNAKALLDTVNPSIAIFVKYEFWYHYLHQTHKRGIPLYCISALFTPKHIFFKPHGSLHRKMLTFFNHLFVQNIQSLELLKSIAINQASISGDTRFDRVTKTLADPDHYPLVEAFKGENRLMIVGSSWPDDMQHLYPAINRSDKGLKFIIAPHEVDEASVQQLIKGLTVPFVRITKADEAQVKDAQVLIIDTIGMLSNVYQYGSFAYIGGAFGDGLHNILEAVTFGLPVIFGNRGLEKFPESLELAELGGAFPFDSTQELEAIFDKLNKEEGTRAQASAICRQYIEHNTGATDKIMNYWERHYAG